MEKLQQRVEKLGGILEVAKALVAERDLDKLLHLIVQAAARVVDADRCSLFLVDRERKELWTKVAQGITMKEIRIPMDRGIAGSRGAAKSAGTFSFFSHGWTRITTDAEARLFEKFAGDIDLANALAIDLPALHTMKMWCRASARSKSGERS